MRLTLQVTLNSGVKITTSREVKTFADVGMFGRKVTEWANQIKRIAPDLAQDKVDMVHVLMDETEEVPRRKRNRKRDRHAGHPVEQAAAASE